MSLQKKGYLVICFSWLPVNALLDFGQKYKLLAADLVSAWFIGARYLENTTSHFLQGKFGSLDMFFIFFGGIASYLTLPTTYRFKKEVHL